MSIEVKVTCFRNGATADQLTRQIYSSDFNDYIFTAVYLDKAKKLGLINDEEGTVDWTKLPGSAGMTHEMCAGIVDKDCSEAEIAKDEILEECGYEVPVDRLQKISTFRYSLNKCVSLSPDCNSILKIKFFSERLFRAYSELN